MSELHQERDRLPRKVVMIVIGAGVAATVVGVCVAWAITRAGPAPAPAAELAPRDRAEVNEIELHSFDQESAAQQLWRADGERLSRFGWVDRDKGVVHIPIETAIEIYLATRPAAAAPERTADLPGEPAEAEEGQP